MDRLDAVQAIVDRLQNSAHVTSVYGDPVEREGVTVVPVARVSFGFGGGFGSDAGATDADDEESAPSEGGGVGGGLTAKPVGVVEISDYDARFVRFGERRRLAGVLFLGLLLGLLLGRRR
ncbi:spore germination protein GerW family protein [Halobacteriaceae archaeon GCM10025711]